MLTQSSLSFALAAEEDSYYQTTTTLLMRTQEIANSNLAVIASLSRLSSGGHGVHVARLRVRQSTTDEGIDTTQQAGTGESYTIENTKEAIRYTAEAAATIISSPSVAYSAQAANIIRSLQATA